MDVTGLKGWETESNTSGTLTTGANYSTTNTVTWDCRHLSKKTIIIQNEGAVQSLTYKVSTRAYDGGELYIFKEDTIAASGQVMVALNNVYSEIQIAVKNGDGQTTATIDYMGRLIG